MDRPSDVEEADEVIPDDVISSPSNSTSLYLSARSQSTTYATATEMRSEGDVHHGSQASVTSTIKDFDVDDDERTLDQVDRGSWPVTEEENSTSNDNNGHPSGSSWADYEFEREKSWIDHSTKKLTDEDRYNLTGLLRSRDINGLINFAKRPGGFKADEMRRLVWPFLVDRSVYETSPRPDQETVQGHCYYNQVVLDVNRSLKRFPPSVKESQRLSMQDQLVALIMRLLIKQPELAYYQGFHDVCVTCLLVLGEEKSFYVLDAICQTHLKSFMAKSMEATSALLEVIPVIIEREDSILSDFLNRSGVGTIFSLSWIITWYSHVLKKYDSVVRLFDVFICSDKLLPVYLAASLVLERREDILQLDCEMASVFQYLSRFLEEEEDDVDFEDLIQKSFDLMDRHDPVEVEKEALKRYEAQKRLHVKSRRKGTSTAAKIVNSVLGFMVNRRVGNIAAMSAVILFVSFVYQFVYKNY